ncbi:MAG: 50S ribosomal protein L6 [Phycisphaeraceae bacterium]
MSRIGKQPVTLPASVKASVSNRVITIEGAKTKLTFIHKPQVEVKVDGNKIVVTRKSDARMDRALHGTTRALIQNMVVGVSEGFKRELELVGVGWSMSVQGNKLIKLNVGYADVREVAIPAGVTVAIVQNKMTITGADKQAVGLLAAKVRSQRPPEPYNGKGIKYSDEIIIRKQGKQFAGGGA